MLWLHIHCSCRSGLPNDSDIRFRQPLLILILLHFFRIPAAAKSKQSNRPFHPTAFPSFFATFIIPCRYLTPTPLFYGSVFQLVFLFILLVNSTIYATLSGSIFQIIIIRRRPYRRLRQFPKQRWRQRRTKYIVVIVFGCGGAGGRRQKLNSLLKVFGC